MSRRALADAVGFQLTWFACAWGAANDYRWVGIMTAATAVVRYVLLSRQPARTVLLILAGGLVGLIAENGLVIADLVRYRPTWLMAGAAPVWIVALWLAFATTLRASKELLGERYTSKAAFLGMILGPLSYMAAERLDALAIPGHAWTNYISIALIWGAAFPAFLALRDRLERQ